ncbi:MAG: hypothetical protein E7668_03890 [Ruminococcaceae bacterium]|nr:hypothetical protein [Oscillospiraceae bacterium]
MRVPYTHESVQLTGRWDTTNPRAAVTTTTGAYIEFAFEGTTALACFDILTNAHPLVRLWIQVDGGAMTEAPIDSYLRVTAPTDGRHTVRIIYKGGTEHDRRWYTPLTGKVTFLGVQTAKPVAIEKDDRKIIEFVGDSITEGVLIDVDYHEGTTPADQMCYIDTINRVYQDDVCATYAWLTAEKLNLRPIIMGYGAVGTTRVGQGYVPVAQEAYPYNFHSSPVTRPQPDYIVINHGANDRSKPADQYLAGYEKLLDVILAMNPGAKVIALSAFCGAHHEELGAFIAKYNEKHAANVTFIDSTGWISPEPLHPLRDGHRAVAEKLVPILKDVLFF